MIDSGQLVETKRVVEKEIEDYKSSTGRENPYPLSGYLNNFFGVFTHGWKTSRDQFQRKGTYLWETPFSKFPFISSGSGLSPIKAEQTPKAFFEIVDEAARTESLGVKNIEALLAEARKSFEAGNDDGYSEKLEEVNKMVLPVYIRMRALGYKHWPDLSG